MDIYISEPTTLRKARVHAHNQTAAQVEWLLSRATPRAARIVVRTEILPIDAEPVGGFYARTVGLRRS